MPEMSDEPELLTVLREIRDIQRQHLEAYQKATAATQVELERQRRVQEEQIARVRSFQAFYRVVVIVATIVILWGFYYLWKLDLANNARRPMLKPVEVEYTL